MNRAPHPMLREAFAAIRDARKDARADHWDRRIPVLDRDFDNFSWSN